MTMTRPRKIEINNELTIALDRLGAVAERYPDLKKDQTFITLQAKLAEIKNRIAEARVRYNEAATAFNTYRQGLLVVIVATLSGFSEAPLYDAKLPDASPVLPVPLRAKLPTPRQAHNEGDDPGSRSRDQAGAAVAHQAKTPVPGPQPAPARHRH